MANEITRFETSFTSFDKTDLFVQGWSAPEPVATILVTHGVCEHSECYHTFALAMNRHKISVVAWDLRGHGRSPGKRGYINDFMDFARDLDGLRSMLCRDADVAKPLYLFGHSMGGLISLRMLQEFGQQGVAGVLLSSPALGVALEIPRWKELLAETSNRFFPKLTLPTGIRYETLTKDEQVLRTIETDPLRHDKASSGIYLGMKKNFQLAMSKANELHIPLLMLLAGRDQLVSVSQAEEFFARLPAGTYKELKTFPDSFHEIFNDLDRESAYEILRIFLKTARAKDESKIEGAV